MSRQTRTVSSYGTEGQTQHGESSQLTITNNARLLNTRLSSRSTRVPAKSTGGSMVLQAQQSQWSSIESFTWPNREHSLRHYSERRKSINKRERQRFTT